MMKYIRDITKLFYGANYWALKIYKIKADRIEDKIDSEIVEDFNILLPVV